MKRVSTDEHEAVVTVPEVVRVAVEKAASVVPLHVEHVEVAVRVRCYIECRPRHHPLNAQFFPFKLGTILEICYSLRGKRFFGFLFCFIVSLIFTLVSGINGKSIRPIQ